jgi:nucleoside-triphosphatase
MKENILITGLPGCGKTSLIKDVTSSLTSFSISGFLTEEVRKGGKRVGFKIKTFKGGEGVLAHVEIRSKYKVGRYGVSLKDLEEMAVVEIKEGIRQGDLIVIDEIGKMELFSELFKEVVVCALESKSPVLGTISLQGRGFIQEIKSREDTEVVFLDRKNYPQVRDFIMEGLSTRTRPPFKAT